MHIAAHECEPIILNESRFSKMHMVVTRKISEYAHVMNLTVRLCTVYDQLVSRVRIFQHLHE